MSRKILIFGGTSFMGRQLVETLLELGDTVFILNRGNKYWGVAFFLFQQKSASKTNF
jgi:nucleoside-diphosphate-sugar epimerase